jgi:ARG/rhodanese/phosphatase superfamily protein
MAAKAASVLDNLWSAEITGVCEAAGLQVFGLRWPASNGHDYATLDEALEEKILEVTEVSQGGTVPTLKVVNRAARMVFLMAGEELVGGKQNRVLNASMMVPAQAEMPIPVTCVERGRWGYRSAGFGSGSSSSHVKLRRIMSRQVSGSYRAVGRPHSDQGAVWQEVNRKMAKMGSRSSSDALHDFYSDYAQKLQALLARLALPEDSNGAVFVIRGRIAGADFFDKPETLRKLWSKLVKSYAADALEETKDNSSPLPPERVTEWLRSAASAEQHWFDSPGLGKDVRIEGDHLAGATLVVDDSPIHLELFDEHEPPESPAPEAHEPEPPAPAPETSRQPSKLSQWVGKLFSRRT